MFEVSLGLNELTIDKVADDHREDLAHVNGVEGVGQHPACSRDHEVTGEDRTASSINLMCGYDASSGFSFVNNVVLEQRGVVCYLDASSQGHHLLILLGVDEVGVLTVL